MPHTKNHQATKDTKGQQISPDLIKAMIMDESKMGQPRGPNGTGATDPMQANNPDDWNASSDIKMAVGLSYNQVMNPKSSIDAGIGMFFLKGINSDSQGNYTTWQGGYNAVMRYNGNTSVGYANRIMEYYKSMVPAKPENYVNP